MQTAIQFSIMSSSCEFSNPTQTFWADCIHALTTSEQAFPGERKLKPKHCDLHKQQFKDSLISPFLWMTIGNCIEWKRVLRLSHLIISTANNFSSAQLLIKFYEWSIISETFIRPWCCERRLEISLYGNGDIYPSN